MVFVVVTMAATSAALPCQCKLTPLQDGTIAGCANQDLTEVPLCVPDNTTILQFSGNIVVQMNTSFTSQKRSLRQLEAHRSHVSDVAVDTFSETPKLWKVLLSHNNIHQLPAGLFDETPLLEVVDLSGNMLRSLPAGLFRKAPRLRRLDLSSNYLSTLPADLLAGCGSQAILRVATNHLATVPAAIIASCSSLVELDASSNQMTVLQADVLAAIAQLAQLNTLLLQGNPWQCDCYLTPLAELLQTRDSLDEELTCGGPAALQDLHVVHAVSQLDCAPRNTSAWPAGGHAVHHAHLSAPPTTRVVTIVAVAAVATCFTAAAIAAFFLKRHRKTNPVDRFNLLVAENS